MSRLIDADVFKENVDYICEMAEFDWMKSIVDAVCEYIKNQIDLQTTVIPEQKWNLSEKYAPPLDEEVLVCHIKNGWITIDELDGDGNKCWWDGCNWDVYDTAWMELPKAYRGYEYE